MSEQVSPVGESSGSQAQAAQEGSGSETSELGQSLSRDDAGSGESDDVEGSESSGDAGVDAAVRYLKEQAKGNKDGLQGQRQRQGEGQVTEGGDVAPEAEAEAEAGGEGGQPAEDEKAPEKGDPKERERLDNAHQALTRRAAKLEQRERALQARARDIEAKHAQVQEVAQLYRTATPGQIFAEVAKHRGVPLPQLIREAFGDLNGQPPDPQQQMAKRIEQLERERAESQARAQKDAESQRQRLVAEWQSTTARAVEADPDVSEAIDLGLVTRQQIAADAMSVVEQYYSRTGGQVPADSDVVQYLSDHYRERLGRVRARYGGGSSGASRAGQDAAQGGPRDAAAAAKQKPRSISNATAAQPTAAQLESMTDDERIAHAAAKLREERRKSA